jgi:acyl-CoA synthetase (AMP-forming)/AMP-acid ligase II
MSGEILISSTVQPDKINFIVFDFSGITWRAKGVLLAHNFPARATTVGGPPQKKLLGARLLIFVKPP